jgi:hypothetical protein
MVFVKPGYKQLRVSKAPWNGLDFFVARVHLPSGIGNKKMECFFRSFLK